MKQIHSVSELKVKLWYLATDKSTVANPNQALITFVTIDFPNDHFIARAWSPNYPLAVLTCLREHEPYPFSSPKSWLRDCTIIQLNKDQAEMLRLIWSR